MAGAPVRRRSRRMLRVKRMFRGLFTKDWQGLLAVLVVLMFLVVAVTAVLSSTPQSQMLAYDDDWDDLSKFRADILNMPLNLSVRTVDSSAASLARTPGACSTWP